MGLNRFTQSGCSLSRASKALLGTLLMALGFLAPALGYAAITIAPVTWNVVGLDSNNVNVGPNNFPVGARVCNDAASDVTATVDFDWIDSNDAFTGDPYINLRPGSQQSLNLSVLANACADAYFEAQVTRTALAYDKTRNYQITATAGNTVSTPTPRQLYVEYLVSQARNGIDDIALSTDGTNFTIVPPGGTMNLVVGDTYWIRMSGFTATQGYNQLESYINLANTVFQVLSVATTYSAPVNPTNTDRLYADACGWDNNPTSPNYRSCVVSDDKAGGDVTNTYEVTILSRATGASAKEPLNSMMYDFSGSSYHYNADYAASARFANIISPSLAKSFAPKTINPNGTSTITFTINNPTTSPITNVNFVDDFPSGMALGPSSTVSYSGCGSPLPAAGPLTEGVSPLPSLSFTGISVAASGTCTITVTAVTATAVGSYLNTTGSLFVGTLNTGSTGSDTLVVQEAPVITLPTTCTSPTTLATWTFPTSSPTPDLTPTSLTSGVTASAGYNLNGGTTFANVAGITTYAWGIDADWPTTTSTPPGVPDAGSVPYFQFMVNAANYGGVAINYHVREPNFGWANPNNYTWIYSSLDNTSYTLMSRPVRLYTFFLNNPGHRSCQSCRA